MANPETVLAAGLASLGMDPKDAADYAASKSVPLTVMTIMRPGKPGETQLVDLAPEPGYRALSAILRPLLDGAELEHVTVLHDGEPADMFVDECGSIKRLPRNEAATAIYRNNWLTQHPKAAPESLPAIYGPAVLFSRRVWF